MSTPFFIALIATHNRPTLLANRALPSIAAQTRSPDKVFVVDDSEPRFRTRNKAIVAEFGEQTGIQIRYINNTRCRGASGAWNSGALEALGTLSACSIDNTYLAILDDDDEWLPCHLKNAESVLCTVNTKRADLLAATFERREPKKHFVLTPPTTINGKDFLVGNPGVCGSTLIIRLPVFMRAGMFDEALLSCTDRDLCFRLSLLPQLNYHPLSQTSVVHYADANRPRISNKDGTVKHAGLLYFSKKYRGWMSNDDYLAFCQRAKKLFGWQPPQSHPRPSAAKLPLPSKAKKDEKIALVIGIIVEAQQFPEGLLTDILQLAKDKRLSSLDVVVMPSSNAKRHLLNSEITKWRNAGLRMYCIDIAVAKPLQNFFGATGSQRPISVNRTTLQHAMSRLTRWYRHPVSWILDGDNRLSAQKAHNGGLISFRPDYVGEILRLRNTGCDAAVGSVCGAAPLPRALSVRTQMVDLLHTLGCLLTPEGGQCAPWQMRTFSSIQMKENYYHDCLPHPYLEQPVGVLAGEAAHSVDKLISALPLLINRLLAGDAVTRPLFAVEHDYAQRGGNTLVFNSAMLCDCPNGFARGALTGLRRQDEMWRIISEVAFDRNIISGFFPVTQVRTDEPPQAPDVMRLANDIAGQAIMQVFKNAVGKKCDNVQQAIECALQADFCHAVQKHANQRLNILQASFLRIAGIAACMRAMINNSHGEAGKEAVAALRVMELRFSQTAFTNVQKQMSVLLNTTILQQTLADFPNDCREFSALKGVWMEWLRNQCRQNAIALLAQHLPGVPLRFLGCGNEGSVFTNNQRAYKVLHHWHSRADIFDTDFLLSLCGKWKTLSGTPYILSAKKDGGDLILEMPYERTVAYQSGYGSGIVALLAECYRAGICYWNITPENLRRKGNKILLIDYGSSIHPLTEYDFDLSVRKAWLCWRWGWRKDILDLLTASLKNPDMPELFGYELMKAAIKRYAVDSRPPDTALLKVLKNKPRRIIDYGCGKGKDAIALAARGWQVSAYDPNMTTKTARRLRAAGVDVINNIDSAVDGYDIVLLRHVLCEISSDTALRYCLNTVRRLLTPRGKVMVTACSLCELVKETTCARNFFPRTADINRKFVYRKQIRTTGNVRAHVHRPEFLLQREFARAGLRVVTRNTVDEINLDLFEYCGGIAQWTLRPLSPRPSVALIIRACAMDAKDAEFQVRQLVENLNAPRGFTKVILAIDLNTKSFLRQHNAGDLSLLQTAGNHLQRQGWVDRVVCSPVAATVTQQLNRQWLGINSDAPQAASGAPLSVVFAAFAACRQRYALHVDIDMLVGRKDINHDYLGEMLAVMEKRNAFTMALNIPGSSPALTENKTPPFRLEVRAGLTDLVQLKKNLPLPTNKVNDMPAIGWHRSADLLIARNNLLSLRGGDQRLFAIHPPNAHKQKQDAMDIVANAAANGVCNGKQWQGNDWDGEESLWLSPLRHEDFIFVICGRNVSVGKINRCLASVVCQRRSDWGVIIIDDASDAISVAQLRQWASAHASRTTFFSRRCRAGGLANLTFAIRRLCVNSKSVIITLDMDDALLGENVLCRLHSEYQRGADVTVGSMLHTKKQVNYPACFKDPYAHRGGNVWQHLRSFKKYLFDTVPDSYMRDHEGKYYDLASDWAYMLPIIKIAKRPVWIKNPLYLYEPGDKNNSTYKVMREKEIARIIANQHEGKKL